MVGFNYRAFFYVSRLFDRLQAHTAVADFNLNEVHPLSASASKFTDTRRRMCLRRRLKEACKRLSHASAHPSSEKQTQEEGGERRGREGGRGVGGERR